MCEGWGTPHTRSVSSISYRLCLHWTLGLLLSSNHNHVFGHWNLHVCRLPPGIREWMMFRPFCPVWVSWPAGRTSVLIFYRDLSIWDSAWRASPSGGYTKAQSFALTVMQAFGGTAHPVVPLGLHMHPQQRWFTCLRLDPKRHKRSLVTLLLSSGWLPGIGSLPIQGQPL